MAKKLVTCDEKLIAKVENVLKERKVPCARVQLHGEEHKGKFLLVTINRHGDEMRKAIKEANPTSKYYFGVLHNHPEYTVPKGILYELSTVKL
jgi:hypothetical protein